MQKWNWERHAAGSGIAFVVLVLVSSFIVPVPPKLTAGSAKIIHYYASHHRAGLVSSILGGLAILAFIWFGASLASKLRDGGEPRLGAAAFGGILVAAGLAGVSGMLATALFYGLGPDGQQAVKPLHIVSALASTFLWYPLAASPLATAIATWRSSILPRWYGAVSALASLIFVFGGAAIAHSGFYAPFQAYSFIVLIAFLVWVLVTTGLLMKQAGGERAPTAAVVTV